MDTEFQSLMRPTRFVVYWLVSEQYEAERKLDLDRATLEEIETAIGKIRAHLSSM